MQDWDILSHYAVYAYFQSHAKIRLPKFGRKKSQSIRFVYWLMLDWLWPLFYTPQLIRILLLGIFSYPIPSSSASLQLLLAEQLKSLFLLDKVLWELTPSTILAITAVAAYFSYNMLIICKQCSSSLICIWLILCYILIEILTLPLMIIIWNTNVLYLLYLVSISIP